MAARIQVVLSRQPILLSWVQDAMGDPDSGANMVFLGTTRRRTLADDATIVTDRLEYEAYQPMAEQELQRLLQEASGKWDLRRLVAVHRLGVVAVGDASVAIGLASPHRLACMQAMPWIMDQLKNRVPIWKQEQFSDGSSQWIHP